VPVLVGTASVAPELGYCGFRAISYTRSDRIRTAIPTFSYTPVRRTPLALA
jgi:hypothetical protein